MARHGRSSGRRYRVPEGGGALSGVSCTSGSACIAVGSFGPGYGPLAERWNGSSWSLQRPPDPADDYGFDGVSCASSRHCIAVGGGDEPLAERWDGVGGRFRPLISAHSFSAGCWAFPAYRAPRAPRSGPTTLASVPIRTTTDLVTATTTSKCLACGGPGAGPSVRIPISLAPKAMTKAAETVWPRCRAHRLARAQRSAPRYTDGTGATGQCSERPSATTCSSECRAVRRIPARRSVPGSTRGTVTTGGACRCHRQSTPLA